jgi:hypothetical protein
MPSSQLGFIRKVATPMENQQTAEIRIEFDGRTIVARPRPEDQATLEELLNRGENATLRLSTADTEGHVFAADELGVDVEGHAMTLRLPNAGDAAALRRALAISALTASVAVGGFAAGNALQSQSHAAPITAPAVSTQWVAPFDAPEAAPAQTRVAPFDAPEAAPAQPWVAPFDAPAAAPDYVAPFDAPEAAPASDSTGAPSTPIHPGGPRVE